jgi:hypothetical protein
MALATASISAPTKFKVTASPGRTLAPAAVPWAGAGCGADCAKEFIEKMLIALASIEYFATNSI